jgi:hypothetical protein
VHLKIQFKLPLEKEAYLRFVDEISPIDAYHSLAVRLGGPLYPQERDRV